MQEWYQRADFSEGVLTQSLHSHGYSDGPVRGIVTDLSFADLLLRLDEMNERSCSAGVASN